MKNALRFALLSAMALAVVVSVCAAAQQAPVQSAPLQRFTVLRNIHVLGPAIDMTADQANCVVTGASDSAAVKCKPVGVTQKSAYTYNVTLVSQADGTAYVIACRIGLVSNLWCKALAEGRILRGTIANGHLKVPDGSNVRDYAVLKTAQIGPLDTDQPEIAAAPAKPAKPAAPAKPTAPAMNASASQQVAAQPAAPPPQQPSPASPEPLPAAAAAPPAAPSYQALDDLPAACISADAADKENSACVSFTSEPSGADIYVDGKFVGNTPSLMPLAAGSHEIRIEAPQRTIWTRTLQATAAGKITIHADLEPPGK